MIPVLLASFLCILFPLVPSIIWGLRIQDRKREKEFFKTLPVRRKGVLRIAVPPACIKRLSDSDLINYLQTEKKKK